MIIRDDLLEEFRQEAGITREQKAEKYVKEKKVNITKVIYDDINNFELRSKVKGSYDLYDVYVKVEDNEIYDVSCTCPDYESHYGTCKHVLATVLEFANNPEYKNIFSQFKESSNSSTKISRKEIERNYNFKQLINVFLEDTGDAEKKVEITSSAKDIRIIPKIIINSFQNKLKVEFKIGQTQMYKLKSLPQFFENMLYNKNHKYGNKLEFVHTEDSFSEESKPLLNFILKYSEIIKYANETSNSYMGYGKTLNESYITISNTGLDDLFEILKGKQIEVEVDSFTHNLLFKDEEPNVNFNIEEVDKNFYKISPNIDIYAYTVFKGKDYSYFMYEHNLYRCSKQFYETTLKLLNVFRENFVKEIEFNKSELSSVFSMVVPKVKDNIKVDKINKEVVEKYIPRDLNTKIYLDYDENSNIVADVKFCYDDIEFNPLKQEKTDFARDIFKENEIIEMFIKSGFLLDSANFKLVLVKEEDIYNFLTKDIEEYMNKFEVMATDSFKQKEIRMPKISSLGVKLENNLLKKEIS